MPSHLRQAKSILLFVVIACANLAAEQVAQLKPTGFVNDYANVINSESMRQMQYLCDQVDKRAQAQIAVVTINTLDGVSIENYAARLFQHWGIGPKSNNRGILILLAVQDHKYRIEVGTGLEAVITNRKAAGFGREAVPFLKQFQYGSALTVITRRVTDAIAADAKITITDAPQPTPAAAYQYSQSSTSSDSAASAIAIFLLVAVALFIVLMLVVKGGQGTGVGRGFGYRGYGYGYPVYQNVGGYYNHSNTYLFSGFGGSSSSSSSSDSSSSSWGGGGGFGGGGDSSGFGGGSSSGSGSSGDFSSSSSSSSSDSSSSSSSSSSDFGGGSSEGGGASGSW